MAPNSNINGYFCALRGTFVRNRSLAGGGWRGGRPRLTSWLTVARNWEVCSVATHSATTNSSAASRRGRQRQRRSGRPEHNDAADDVADEEVAVAYSCDLDMPFKTRASTEVVYCPPLDLVLCGSTAHSQRKGWAGHGAYAHGGRAARLEGR